MSREIITHMVGQTSAFDVWKALVEIFPLQSKARVVQLRTHLNKTHKENKIMEVYFNEIKTPFFPKVGRNIQCVCRHS
jgi:hypothetical protein